MSNFINEYKNLHDQGEVLSIIKLFSDSEEISEIDNITSDVGKTILAMGKDGNFSIASHLKNRGIIEIYDLHTHLAELSKNIDSYIKNRSFIQRLKDFFIDQRFFTLYKLKRSLPKILATLEKKEGMGEKLEAAAIKVKRSEREQMKKEKLEKLDSTLEKLYILSQSTVLTRDALIVLVKAQQKIENLKKNLSHDTTLPIFCEPKTNLSEYVEKLGELNLDISRISKSKPTIQNDNVNKTAEKHSRTLMKLRKDLQKNGNVTIPKYEKKSEVSNLMRYVEKLEKLDLDISQLEESMPTMQDDNVKETAKEHLKTLRKLRKDLQKDGNVTMPKYGKRPKTLKDGTTKTSENGNPVFIKNNVIDYVVNQASLKATAKNNQKE